MNKWENEIRETKDASSAREQIKKLTYTIESFRDFIEWLFEHSEHCNHISQREAWEEFEKYNEKNHD